MVSKIHHGQTYYQNGESPRSLYISGFHGDEHEIIHVLKDVLHQKASELPDFVFLPVASPSAVQKRTRYNASGNDLNRCFQKEIKDPEAQAVVDIVNNYDFELSFSFHEDPEMHEEFYFYDSDEMTALQLQEFRKMFAKHDAQLYSGVDDPNDSALGFPIVDGYWNGDPRKKNGGLSSDLPSETSGFFEEWIHLNNRSTRSLCIEVPGKATLLRKKEITALTINMFASVLK
jgi:hypothetical protein